jgi:uncharacterized protein (TIGR00369 family)
MSKTAPTPLPPELAELMARGAEATPFTAHVGLTIEKVERGLVVARLPFRAQVSRSFGIVHGGALMTLMDVAAGLASASTVADTWEQGTTNVTIASSAQFLSVARGVDLVAVARCTKAGRSISFCEVEVSGGDEVIARGAFTFKTTRMAKSRAAGLRGEPPRLRVNGNRRQATGDGRCRTAPVYFSRDARSSWRTVSSK